MPLAVTVTVGRRRYRERKEQKRQLSSHLCRRRHTSRRRRCRCSLSSQPLGVVAPLTVRCSWHIQSNPERRLLSNIAFLESCCIVGSQLSALLKIRPRLFIHDESKLRDIISRVSDLGFSVNSRMFVHGLIAVSGISKETFERKLELFTSFGFTEHEFMEMFHKQPMMLSRSEEQLKLGIDFFLSKPCCLCFSPVDRLIPRYKVMQILKSKRLLKEPNFVHVVTLSEEKFLDRYVTRFRDDAKDLLVAYNFKPCCRGRKLRDVKLEYKTLKEKMKEYNQKEAKFYGNMFAKMNKLGLLNRM